MSVQSKNSSGGNILFKYFSMLISMIRFCYVVRHGTKKIVETKNIGMDGGVQIERYPEEKTHTLRFESSYI